MTLQRIKKFFTGKSAPVATPVQDSLMAFPGYICLEITNSCNLRCEQCLYKGTTTDHYVGKAGLVDVEFAKSVLRQLGEQKCAVMLNGDGESLLHPRFLEIAEYAMTQNLPSVYFNTNATKLDAKVADELCRFFKGSIQISLDGFKESHERIRIGSDYETVFRNVEYLRQRIKETGAEISLTVSYCRYDQPAGEMADFVKYWIERVDCVSTGVVWDKEYKLLTGAEEGYDPVERIKCQIPWQTMIVRWNGKVIPCSNCFTKGYEGYFIMGDANETSLVDIWKGAQFAEWRARHDRWDFKDTVCETCDRWKMCVTYPDKIENGLQVSRSGCFTTFRKSKD